MLLYKVEQSPQEEEALLCLLGRVEGPIQVTLLCMCNLSGVHIETLGSFWSPH